MSDPSQEDLEAVVRAAFDAVSRRDLDAAVGYLHQNAVMDMSHSRSPYKGVYRGRDAVRALWQELLDAWEEISWELVVIARPRPDTLVLESTPRARGRGSGIELGGRGGWVWRFREGKLVHGILFQTPDEALAAATVAQDPPPATRK